MRADRLIAILLVLQARGRVTAAALAIEFEVSVTTIRRDLEALAAAGVPVYAERGRDGGWSLLGGGRLNLSGLTRSEAEALFQQLGAADAASPAARAALRKLLGALPAPTRAASEAARGTIVVDRDRWGEHSAADIPQLAAIRGALLAHRTVELRYVDRSRHGTTRTVDPMGLVNKAGTWYLVAETAEGRRTFRADRIDGVSVTQTPSSRPTDTDLALAWQRIADEVEVLRARVRATVRVPAHYVLFLQKRFGRNCEVIGTDHDGWVRASVAGPSEPLLAHELAGWGADLEVREPKSLRAELARIGRDLVTQYGRSEPPIRARRPRSSRPRRARQP